MSSLTGALITPALINPGPYYPGPSLAPRRSLILPILESALLLGHLESDLQHPVGCGCASAPADPPAGEAGCSADVPRQGRGRPTRDSLGGRGTRSLVRRNMGESSVFCKVRLGLLRPILDLGRLRGRHTGDAHTYRTKLKLDKEVGDGRLHG